VGMYFLLFPNVSPKSGKLQRPKISRRRSTLMSS
jgi:hypothetical protein